jgi:hypothetical protein
MVFPWFCNQQMMFLFFQTYADFTIRKMGWWWFMMIYDDLWWFMMIYDDLWWFMMIYDDLWVGQNWITTWIQFCIIYIGTSIQTIREEQDCLTIRHANSMGNWAWQVWILPPVKVRFHHCETGLS